MGKHRGAEPKGKFCCSPKDKNCGDCPVNETADKGKNYVAICDPGWSSYTYLQYVNGKPKPYVYEEEYEAHHILCVESVNPCILGTRGIQKAVRQTRWCINDKVNMIAMPLLGHVVKYYCRIEDDPDDATAIRRRNPPPFNGIPCHDVSHNLYQEEIDTALMQVAVKVKDADHDVQAATLKTDLDNQSKRFRKELNKRGMRKDGIHEGWRLAHLSPPDKEWNHPFSMAHNAATGEIAMPTIDKKKKEWIERMSKAVASGLTPR